MRMMCIDSLMVAAAPRCRLMGDQSMGNRPLAAVFHKRIGTTAFDMEVTGMTSEHVWMVHRSDVLPCGGAAKVC